MKLIAAIDTETTGLDPAHDRVIEVGAVLWDADSKRPMQMLSELIKSTDKIPEQASKVNGIQVQDLTLFGISPSTFYPNLSMLINRADYIMGHNIKAFDVPFLQNEYKRLGYQFPDKPLIDSLYDIKYIHGDLSRKLSHIAAAHGIINPFPHRAVFDALTMLKVASMHNFDEIIKRASIKSKTIKAMVSYDHRQLAKDHGFHYDGNGSWIKEVKEEESYPFPTTTI